MNRPFTESVTEHTCGRMTIVRERQMRQMVD